MKPIVTLTLNPSIDDTAEADVVRHTHKIRITAEQYDPGGGGINVTRVIKELGGNSIALYMSGGTTGQVFDELLGSRGIPRRRIPIAQNTRVCHLVYERSTGLEYRFIPEGPEVSEIEWKRCLFALKDLDWDWCVGSGSLPRGIPADFYVQLADLVAARGGHLVLDTSGKPLDLALERGGIELMKPSQGEFEKLVGRALPTNDDMVIAAREMIAAGKVKMIAITMGEDGALLVTPDTHVFLQSPKVEVKSASGAGDSFVGGMVFGLASGLIPEDAFRLGVACGTASVITSGTQLCHKADVDRFLEQIGSHHHNW
ncbi:1-phosphofructokinase family hexose kinase [Oryzibacter oryziterrae]|uniref:1-phosphofructokinase family hexose kinase n=1 Tax=Oryzibacter oryziterrae TaxID=2766474 RepID=UPI001F34416E|nr:1-phosphofructokinase family hexose kinase [Oryzibacter oryziterrae]